MPKTLTALPKNTTSRIESLIAHDNLPAPITSGADHVTWRRSDLETWHAEQRPASSAVLNSRTTGSGYAREAADFYREPRLTVEALFETLPDIQGPIYDPDRLGRPALRARRAQIKIT